MKKQQYIKLISHNDLDGFGAPLLLKALQPELFSNVTFDLTTCSAGKLDQKLEHFFRQPDIQKYSDIYIMDMTPDNDYSFQQLEQHFANHWLIFDHHESEEELRKQYASNCILPSNPAINPSAVSLVWDWVSKQVNFANVSTARQQELQTIVELIRAYDTWDWQNDPNMCTAERKAADELNQLFWFYPLSQSESFVSTVYQMGWEQYRNQNTLLINTLNGRRQRYLDKHLKNVIEFSIDDHSFGVVYASDFKSEIAHALLQQHDVDAALVIDAHSVSLRSNGKLDVAEFATKYFNGGGHADSAGGTLPINPIETAEKKVVEAVKEQAQINAETQKQENNEVGNFADSIDEETAAKLATLFKSKH
ncbi:DHHA1 domain-containing protein [Ligilactobacillus araffinosus]|uniref:DHHA1 domain-containing protein n=1 Tax=Ligilactobacillus araffinosus TaxID=147809 RepID=UPI00070E2980|nr:DHHA1 domain-containing protein [Ligilactobacillus araffinosus]